MFYKIALKNVTKSIRDYTVYFLTLTFGVCLFYMFNSIDSQAAMLRLSKSQMMIMHTLIQVIGSVSVFISIVLGFLVVYANQFLIRRRKKELAIYMTLGMAKGKISRILMLETLIIGVFSLAVGLLAGVFAAQGLSVVTSKMFEVNLKAFTFTFSADAFYKTVLYFGIIFLIVMLFSTISISRYKLIDLINASKKNQKMRFTNLWIPVIIFLVSAVCLGISYYLINKNGMSDFNGEFAASLIFGSVGTLLFFLSLSGFLLRVVQSNKRLYYKNLNMFVLRQINSKINTTFVSMSVICIMLLITIGTLSTGMGLSSVMSIGLKESTPYDVTFQYGPAEDEARNEKAIDMAGQFSARMPEFSRLVKAHAQLTGYESDFSYSNFMQPGAPALDNKIWDDLSNMQVLIIPQSDYNAAMKLQEKPAVSLKENEFLLSCSYDFTKPLMTYFVEHPKTIKLNGKTLALQNRPLLNTKFLTSYGDKDSGTLIVPDSLVKGLKKSTVILNLQYAAGVTDEQFQAALQNAFPNSDGSVLKPYNIETSKQRVYDQSTGSKTMVAYLAIYIGMVFLITSAAVLALQQLSEASDNLERYGLLQKLGAEESMIHHSLFTQIAIYFMLPLALAIVHSAVGIYVANRLVSQLGHVDIMGNTLITAVVFILIYGGYFLATYFGSRSMLRQRRN